MGASLPSDDKEDDWSIGGAPDDTRALPTKRGVLTAAEIEALLRPDLSDIDDAPAATRKVEPSAIRDLSDDALAGDAARDQAAGRAAALTLALRRDCALDAAVRLAHCRDAAFAEAVSSVRPHWASLFFGDETGVRAALLLDDVVAGSIISIACGAPNTGGDTRAPRELSVLDSALLESLLKPLARTLGEGYELLSVETKPEYAIATAPPAQAVEAWLDVATSHGSGRAVMVLGDAPTRPRPIARAVEPGAEPRGAVAVATARVASLSVPVSRLSDLKPGATLLLGAPADQPVEILSGGRDGALAAEGEIGRRGGKIAIRITRRGPALG
ncbi:MAG: FliM/FliN family flagellar motor switch protein [Pseudomonadota bacterium]